MSAVGSPSTAITSASSPGATRSIRLSIWKTRASTDVAERSASTGFIPKGEVVIGSVVGRPRVERVRRLVSDAVANGATVLTGGGSDGTVMKGIVVDPVTPRDAIVSRL